VEKEGYLMTQHQKTVEMCVGGGVDTVLLSSVVRAATGWEVVVSSGVKAEVET
jgi:hypothetical protein